MGRRLFERLEKRVEGMYGEHVHFVYDVNLVAAPRRRVPDVLPEVANLLYAAVGGAVYLYDVHGAAFVHLGA